MLSKSSLIYTLLLLICILKIDAIQNLTISSIHLNKCCPIGQYVDSKQKCVQYNGTLNFSKVDVFNKDMLKTGKSVEDVFTLIPSKFEDEDFIEEALDVTLLGFNEYVTEDGVLSLEQPNDDRRTYIAPENYCVDFRVSDRNKTLPRFWAIIKHLNKCCPFGLYVGRKQKCVEYNGTLNFSRVDVFNKEMLKTGKSLDDVFTLIPSKFEDFDFKELALDVTMLEFKISVTEDGVLSLEQPNTYERWTLIAPGNYCVDFRVFKNNPNKTLPRFWAILPGEELIESNVYLTSMLLISCFFMFLVLVVYILLPELQNLCGMILMSYVASLFMAFLYLSIIQIQQHTEAACIHLTMGIYFFFLAAFCWMSVMSYDIWWTFRGYAKARPIHRRGENFKYCMYSLYAWGVPLGMTIGLYVLNIVDMSHWPWFVTPHVPTMGCFLEGGVKLLYLYCPMLILIICNWIFYLMTSFNIWRLSRGTAVLDSAAAGNPQAHRTHRHRFMVYLKLSIVMGLNWLLEIISFLYPGFKMWNVTDLYNILIGFAIFLIFVCKKKIYRMLRKRYLESKKRRWHPSSRSYSSSSESSQETATLNSKVSFHPKGSNGFTTSPINHRFD